MIVFYKDSTKIRNLTNISCENSCTSPCIKPKSKCCLKFKKKGVNCKRCPNLLLQKAS